MNNMSIKEKHLHETNRLTFICLMIIQALALVSVFLFANSRSANLFVCLAAVLIGITITVVGRVKFVTNDKGHLVMFIGMAISYFCMMWTNVNTPYVYGFTFLVCFVIVLHRNTRICLLATVVAFLGNGVYTVEYVIATNRDRIIQVISDDLMALLACVIAYLIVRRMNLQNDEMLSTVQENAAKQERTANEVKNKAMGIKELLENANEYVNNLSESIDSSAAAMTQITDATKLTAESIQTQTDMSANITDSLGTVVEMTREMANSSEAAIAVITEGNETVEALKKQSQKVADINRSTAELTAELQTRAEGIKEVVNTILEISSETNLLSLNASIEAARAGEAGKGFAVVADEIRNLSDSTKDSAQQISEVIDTLVENISNASVNMKETVQQTQDEAMLITKTGEAFARINDSVMALSDAVNEIEKSVEASADANGEVMDSITNLSATSEEVVASTESSLTITNDCVETMENTKNILDRIFELSESL